MTMTGSSPAKANVDCEAAYGCHARLPLACYYCRQHPTSAFSLLLPPGTATGEVEVLNHLGGKH
jgi:hypothetical protein